MNMLLTGYRARSMEGLLAFSFIMRAAAKAILKDDDFFFSLIHDCTIHFLEMVKVLKKKRRMWSLINVKSKNGP